MDPRPVLQPDSGSATWLCPTEMDRARLLEMGTRNVGRRRVIGGVVAATLLLAAPRLGWWPLVALAAVMTGVQVLERNASRWRRPEYPVLLSWVVVQCVIGIAVMATGGVLSPLLVWAPIMVPSLAARFPPRATLVGCGFTAAWFSLAATLGGIDALGREPGRLGLMVAAVVVVGLVTTSITASDRNYRVDAVMDPLTGLLNRSSLEARYDELVAQAHLAGSGICVVLCDVDHFKSVNDDHGHERGDVVLQEVAHLVRRSLRQFELVYRFGGEEFLVLLPGVSLDNGVAAAERIRQRIEEARPGGLGVTVSCGVAAGRGRAMEFARLFAGADAALYAAKGRGRNRVVAARSPERSASPAEIPRGRAPLSETCVPVDAGWSGDGAGRPRGARLGG